MPLRGLTIVWGSSVRVVELLGPEFARYRGQEENMPLQHHQSKHSGSNAFRTDLLDHQTHFGYFLWVLDRVVRLGGGAGVK
jgi:hypothetical protein